MDTAQKIAFQDELMLAGWAENHTGGAKVTFWLADAAALDIFRNMTTKKGNTAGQRFMAVLVEIGDDDKPVALALSSRCALMCKSTQFQQFVEQQMGFAHDAAMQREAQARDYVCARCNIESRRELDTNGTAALAWQQLQHDFAAWLRG